jgi:methylenetetrahydrofolate dehydrogenase (NADP+)/methenyltetrahydrofolate cyclohydrolase
MIIDGRAFAQQIKEEVNKKVRTHAEPPTLGLVVVKDTPEIHKFTSLKQAFGKEVGVPTTILEVSYAKRTTEGILGALLHATHLFDAVVLQLPLPPLIDLDAVFRFLPITHDVDVLGDVALTQYKEGHLPFHPPVVGAMKDILEKNGIGLAGRKVLVVGQGRLVGLPATMWAKMSGAQVMVATKETENLADLARSAEVLILGAGVPALITPDMVQDGAIILDAGTSEVGGVLRGDADPSCAEKARIFTPTPGGIGPMTVAKVFENVLTLAELKKHRT